MPGVYTYDDDDSANPGDVVHVIDLGADGLGHPGIINNGVMPRGRAWLYTADGYLDTDSGEQWHIGHAERVLVVLRGGHWIITSREGLARYLTLRGQPLYAELEPFMQRSSPPDYGTGPATIYPISLDMEAEPPTAQPMPRARVRPRPGGGVEVVMDQPVTGNYAYINTGTTFAPDPTSTTWSQVIHNAPIADGRIRYSEQTWTLEDDDAPDR